MSSEQNNLERKNCSKKVKTLEERIQEKDDKYQKMLEKAKQYEAQRKQLEKRKKAEERKEATHRKIRIGGIAEAVLGRPFTEEDMVRFQRFLNQQEMNGKYYSKAMNKPLHIEHSKE